MASEETCSICDPAGGRSRRSSRSTQTPLMRPPVVPFRMAMPSRADMDRPATAAAASLGVVLIAAGVLLFVATAPAAAKTFTIAWTQTAAPGGSKDAPFAGNGQKASVPVTVSGALSNVTVKMAACSDTPGLGGSPAAITYELFKDNKSVAQGSAPCQQGNVKTLQLHPHPDAGKADGADAAAAETAAYGAKGYSNATHTFRLDFSWSRPAGTVPTLPVGGAQFAGRMGIEVQEWKATANLPQGASK